MSKLQPLENTVVHLRYGSKDYFLTQGKTILTLSELNAKLGIGQKPAPEVWETHYTKSGHTLHRDHIILADGTKYTVEELSNRANLLLSLSRAHRKFFPK